MKVRTGLLLASSAALLTMTGCVDQDKSYFDAEKAAAEYAAAFPATDIDPNQDWKTTSNVSLNIAVEEDEGVSYTVRVYTANPLVENSDAKLLAEGVARKGQPYVSTFDLPNHLEGVFVARTDEHNRHLVKYVSLTNGAITTTFGLVSTRSGFTSGVKTRADENADAIPDKSPAKSESEIKALISGATELTESVKPVAGGVYYIPAGKTVGSGQSWAGGTEDDDRRTTIIIAGTCTSTVKVEDKVDIYVLNGGTYAIPSGESLEITNSSRFTMYEGSSLTGGTITFANGNDDYWAGSIDVEEITTSGGNAYNYGSIKVAYANFTPGILYNHGKVEITTGTKNNIVLYSDGTVTAESFQGLLVNRGTATVKNITNKENIVRNYNKFDATESYFGTIENYGEATINNVNLTEKQGNKIINNCHLTCYGNYKGIIDGKENSKTIITGGYNVVYTGDNKDKNNSSLSLEKNSLLEVKETMDIPNFAYGPSDGYALIKVGYLANGWITPGNISGNFYIEMENNGITTDSEWANFTSRFTQAEYGTSPIVISDCTGSTTEPETTGKTKLPSDYQNYVYVFEDNYPAAGDYDFNDLVLDVTSTPYADGNNNIVSYDIDVTLKAVGASNVIGSALRLYGIESSKIGTVTIDDPDGIRNTLSLGSSLLSNEIKESGAGDYVVIPLFGDAHQALGVTDRAMTNTGVNKVVSPKSITLHITTSETISKDNLDFFITNGKKVGGNRVEVHLFEFLKSAKPATDKGTECPEEASVISGNNYTFAFSAAGFKYPKEYISVADAYPDFAAWAANREVKLDWYKNPNTSTDKEYIYSGQ